MVVGHRLELVQGHLLRGQEGAELLDTEESGWRSDGGVRRSWKRLQPFHGAFLGRDAALGIFRGLWGQNRARFAQMGCPGRRYPQASWA